MTYEWIGFLLVAGLALFAAVAWSRRLPGVAGKLLVAAVCLRIVGSTARHEVLFRVYHGIGDATGYFGSGKIIASFLWALDFSIFDSSHWHAGNWWGTQFVRYVSGLVISVVGPSLRAEFLVFSLFSFLGLCFYGLAFHRAYPHLSVWSYLRWLWLWPSLWFWPSSVGKDALMVLAGGLVAAGFIGVRGKIQWLPLISGLALATAIRPHVGALMVLALGGAQVLSADKRLQGGQLVRLAALGVLAFFLLGVARTQLGLGEADLEGVKEFAETRATLTEVGGSNVGAPGVGLRQLPIALVNVLLRPFPFEAHNAPALVASLELVVLWILFWRRRRQVWGALRHWRSDRLLRFALPLTLAYVAMIGMVFGNLGIIARQRVVVFPFLLLLLEAVPVGYVRELHERYERARRRWAWRPWPSEVEGVSASARPEGR